MLLPLMNWIINLSFYALIIMFFLLKMAIVAIAWVTEKEQNIIKNLDIASIVSLRWAASRFGKAVD